MNRQASTDNAPKLPDGVPPLGTIYFYLTEGCNLACRHCWLSPSYDREGTTHATLPVELFRRAIEEAKPLGLNTVKLTGGEPLLHPEFPALLEIAGAAKVAINIETNGVLGTPEIARRIAAVPRSFVSVSLDGADAETHEWLRGVPGCFDKACDTVRYLAQAGMAPQIIMSIVGRNADQVEAMLELAEKLGAKSIKFNLIQPTARGKTLHDQGQALTVERLIEIGRHVNMELSKRTDIRLFYDYPPAFRPLSELSVSGGFCGILGIIGVLSTGHYALCGIGMHIKKLVFGRVGEDNLKTVWERHPVLAEIREGLPLRLNGICRQCLMKHCCLGSCLAQNYYGGNSLWGPYWFCREAAERGVFPATRLASGRSD